MTQFSSLHPFTLWRFRRRLRGGAAHGDTSESVLNKLGEPARRQTDRGHEVWDYEVGRTRSMNVFYSVLFDAGNRVHSSWWTESTGSLRAGDNSSRS